MKYPHSLFKPMRQNSVDSLKRRTLKIMGGSAALAGTITSSLMSPGAMAAEPTSAIENSTGRTGHNTGKIAISIMTNKSMTYDWILMENLSGQPLEVTKFNPGVIGYLGKQLDLNQLLVTNATNGALQLHNDYAWSDSLYSLPDRPVQGSNYHQLQADRVIESISADTRVVKCWANVVESSAEIFIGDPPETFA